MHRLYILVVYILVYNKKNMVHDKIAQIGHNIMFVRTTNNFSPLLLERTDGRYNVCVSVCCVSDVMT